ncbi:hypothetical protein [Planktotalea sp.]|uniref:hypothetical protein n=1 Tax=Planktotalea sp. TaxID=2029877 RepID=UPI003D6AD1FA
MTAREFDLLGDPIPVNRGSAGANGHIATSKNINKVRLLVAAKWTAAQIAEELGVSVPTLNKHYFRNSSIKKARLKVIAEVRGRVMLRLGDAIDDGNVAAMKHMGQILDRIELEEASAEFLIPKSGQKVAKKKVGKKEQRAVDAPEALSDFLDQADSQRLN